MSIGTQPVGTLPIAGSRYVPDVVPPPFSSQVTIPADASSWAVDASGPVNWEHPLCKGLVGWWMVLPGNNGGSKFKDLCKKNDGTFTNGPTWAGPGGRPGGFGAVSFDGTNDGVNCGTPAAMNFERTDSFSVSVWFRSNSIAAQQCLVGNQLQPGGSYRGWELSLSGSRFDFYLRSTTANQIRVTGSTALASNMWYHATYTYDGSVTAAGLRGYLNGVAESMSVSANTLTTTTQSSAPVVIGVLDLTSPTIPFGGLIDGVAVWSHALSAAEVSALYKDSRLGHPDMLRRVRPRIARVFVPGPAVFPKSARQSSPQVDMAGPVNWSHPLNKGLVGWWLVTPGNNNGAKWRDLTKRNDGVLTNGPVWSPAKSPSGFGAVSFFGVSGQFVAIPSTPALSFGTGMSKTICVWHFDPTGPVPGGTMIVAKDGATKREWGLAFGNRQLTFSTFDDAGASTSLTMATPTQYTAGRWNWIAVGYDASIGKSFLQFNGGAREFSGVHNDVTSGTQQVTIGSSIFNFSQPQTLDGVQVFNRVLSAAEIRQLYENAKLGYPGRLSRTVANGFSPTDTVVLPRKGIVGTIDSAGPLNRSHPLARGLVGFWLATPDQKGAKWRDIAGRNDGVLTNGPVFKPNSGRPGGYGAVSFDGTDDVVSCGDVKTSAPASVGMWVYPTDVDESAIRRLVGNLTGGTGVAGAFGIGGDGNGSQPGSLWVWSGSAWLRLAANGTIPANAWSRIDVTFSSGGTATGYVNGVATGTASSGFAYTGATFALSAKLNNQFGSTYAGLMDGATVHNRALSAAEVAALYRESVLGYPTLLNRRGWAALTAALASTFRAWRARMQRLVGGGVG